MKKQNFFRHMVLGVAVVLLACLASCSDTPKYARVIAKDAHLVASINVKQMAEKAQGDQGQKVNEALLKQLEQQGFSAELQSKAKAIVEDPAEAGIDLRKPVLVFVENVEEETGGLVAALHDADKFAELCNAMAKQDGKETVKQEGDVRTLALDDQVAVAFNDDMLLLYVENKHGDVLAEAKRRLSAEDAQGVLERDDFKQMCKATSDAQLLLSGKMVKEGSSDADKFKELLPADVKPEDFSVLVELNSEKEQLVLSAQLISLTDAAQKAVEKCGDALGSIRGDLLDYVPASSLFVLSTNLKGSGLNDLLLPALKKQGNLSTEQEQLAEKVMKSLEGDAVLSVNSFDLSQGPEVFLIAKVDDEKQMKEAVAKLGGAALEEVEPGQYSMQGNTYLGVKNGMFYVSSKQPVLSMTKPKEAVDASRFEGNLLCGELNVKGLMANPLLQSMTQANSNARMAAPLLKEIDKLDYVVVDRDKVELRLQLEKADKNPLQLLVEEACKL